MIRKSSGVVPEAAQAIVSSGAGGSPPLRRISRSKATKSARFAPLGKKLRGTHGCQLLGNGGGDELVDADTVLLGSDRRELINAIAL